MDHAVRRRADKDHTEDIVGRGGIFLIDGKGRNVVFRFKNAAEGAAMGFAGIGGIFFQKFRFNAEGIAVGGCAGIQDEAVFVGNENIGIQNGGKAVGIGDLVLDAQNGGGKWAVIGFKAVVNIVEHGIGQPFGGSNAVFSGIIEDNEGRNEGDGRKGEKD